MKKTSSFLLCAAAAAAAFLLGPTSTATAAYDAFLKFGGIDGESLVEGREGSIEILSFSWGVSRLSSISGGDATRPVFADLSVRGGIDKSSPKLSLACARGDLIPEVKLSLVSRTGDEQIEFYSITLTDVLVSSVGVSGERGEDRPVQTLSLNFSEITWTYVPIDPGTGRKGDPIMSTWTIEEGSVQ